MNMKRALFIIVLVLIAAAYAGGYWPEHRRFAAADARARGLQTQLNAAEARIRLGEVFGQLLRLSDAVTARNYGEAATLSSAYFDRVAGEVARAEPSAVKQLLEGILQSRDQVTTLLARTDPTVAAGLQEQEIKLRRALGYAVETAAPAAAEAPVR